MRDTEYLQQLLGDFSRWRSPADDFIHVNMTRWVGWGLKGVWSRVRPQGVGGVKGGWLVAHSFTGRTHNSPSPPPPQPPPRGSYAQRGSRQRLRGRSPGGSPGATSPALSKSPSGDSLNNLPLGIGGWVGGCA